MRRHKKMFQCPPTPSRQLASVVSGASSVATVSAGLFLSAIAANVVLNSLLFIVLSTPQNSCPRQMAPLKGDEQILRLSLCLLNLCREPIRRSRRCHFPFRRNSVQYVNAALIMHSDERQCFSLSPFTVSVVVALLTSHVHHTRGRVLLHVAKALVCSPGLGRLN